MILKRRDVYILLMLLLLVGYSVIQRLNNQSKNAPDHLEAESKTGFDTASVSRSPGNRNISATFGN